VGLLSPCGYGNLGDAATQDAVLQNLRARWPDLEIVGFYLNPADTEERHGIPSFPLQPGYAWPAPREGARDVARLSPDSRPGSTGAGRSFRQLLKSVPILSPILRALDAAASRLRGEVSFTLEAYRLVQGLDALVMSGGGQIADEWGGAWWRRHPFTLFRWTLVARIARVRILFLSVGAGPIATSLSRWFARRAMALADYVSYRDATSQEFMESIGFRRAGRVYHDLAYGVPLSPPPRDTGADSLLVSIGTMPYFDPRIWPEKDAAVYADYLDKMTGLIRRLVARGYRIALFASNIHMDAAVIEDLLLRLEESEPRLPQGKVVPVEITQVGQLVALLAASRFVVASRYHGVLLAHRVGTPALGLSYHPKVRAAMEEMDNLAYCLELSTWTAASAEAALAAMEAAETELRHRIAARVDAYSRALTRQYDEVFGTATP
jgi:polysaccharide pyruvyl transferase WcaK-like protein